MAEESGKEAAMSMALFNSLGEKIEFQLMKMSRDRRDSAKFDMILISGQAIPAKVFYRALTLLLLGKTSVAVGNFKIEEDRRDFVIMFGASRYSFDRINFLKIVVWALRQAPFIAAVAASQTLEVAAIVLADRLYERFPPANHTEIKVWVEVWSQEDKEPATVA